jgi:hypothetical protein
MNNQLGIILLLLAASNLMCGVSLLLFLLRNEPKQEERNEECGVEYDYEPKRLGHVVT